jgi:hypothetical protein
MMIRIIYDIKNDSTKLYKLKKDECKGCEYKEMCNTFHEPVKGVGDDDTCITE